MAVGFLNLLLYMDVWLAQIAGEHITARHNDIIKMTSIRCLFLFKKEFPSDEYKFLHLRAFVKHSNRKKQHKEFV